MAEILDNIYIWEFLVNIESFLLLALLRYMLCSHFTQNCILLYFLEAKNPYFVTKNCWKSSYICVFILSQKRCNWFHKNPDNSGTVGRRKLSDPSFNRIFNALSIGVEYMLSFQWTNFGLKCQHQFIIFFGKLKKVNLKLLFFCCAIYKLQNQETILHRRADVVRNRCSWKLSKFPRKAPVLESDKVANTSGGCYWLPCIFNRISNHVLLQENGSSEIKWWRKYQLNDISLKYEVASNC